MNLFWMIYLVTSCHHNFVITRWEITMHHFKITIFFISLYGLNLTNTHKQNFIFMVSDYRLTALTLKGKKMSTIRFFKQLWTFNGLSIMNVMCFSVFWLFCIRVNSGHVFMIVIHGFTKFNKTRYVEYVLEFW